MHEKRKHQRVDFDVGVRLQVAGGDEHHYRTKNISYGGVMICPTEAIGLQVGDECTLFLTMPVNTTPMSMQFKSAVRHVSDRTTGLEFLSMKCSL